MKLHELKSQNPKKTRKRRGQGNGSGRGTFSGRGCKGQNCRSGGGVRLGFEGGQTPLIQRMPKQPGFRNPNRVESQVVNLSTLNEHFKDGETVSFETLTKRKVIAQKNPKIKILGDGELTKKLTIEDGVLVSKSAQKAIEKAGGTLGKTDSASQKAK